MEHGRRSRKPNSCAITRRTPRSIVRPGRLDCHAPNAVDSVASAFTRRRISPIDSALDGDARGGATVLSLRMQRGRRRAATHPSEISPTTTAARFGYQKMPFSLSFFTRRSCKVWCARSKRPLAAAVLAHHLDVEVAHGAAELRVADASDSVLTVHAKDRGFVTVERDGLAVASQTALRRCKVVERRFATREPQFHELTGGIVDVHEQCAARATALNQSCSPPSICTSSPRQSRRARGGLWTLAPLGARAPESRSVRRAFGQSGDLRSTAGTALGAREHRGLRRRSEQDQEDHA